MIRLRDVPRRHSRFDQKTAFAVRSETTQHKVEIAATGKLRYKDLGQFGVYASGKFHQLKLQPLALDLLARRVDCFVHTCLSLHQAPFPYSFHARPCQQPIRSLV